MKKVMSALLSAALVASAAVAAPPLARPGTEKIAVELSKPSDFKKKPFRQLVPTRSQAMRPARVKGLAGAPAQPLKALKRSTPRAAAAGDETMLSAGIQLKGCVVASSDMAFVQGLYTVPVTADGSFELIASGVVAEYGAYDDGAGRYYVPSVVDWGMGFVYPELYVYSTETWEEIDYISDCDFTILGTDNAVDPTSGSVYGCFYDEDYANLAWGKADYASGRSEIIKILGENEKMYGVACDGNGQYYAVLGDGSFVKVDKATGELTVVGDTGLRPYFNSSAAFDTKSNTFIFCYSPVTGTGSMWGIDPATGAATLIVDFPDNNEVTALTVVSPDAEPLAPAAPIFSVSAPLGSMTARYEIAMPSTLFNGDPQDGGALKWTLMIDGEVANSGESAFGATVESSYVFETKGNHSFVAYVENEVGKSPNAKASAFIGSGIPKKPAGLKATADADGTVRLSWNAVTESADGGYVNPDEVTYTVSRDGEVIKEGVAATGFEETLEIPDTYRKLNYEVKAVYDGASSEPAAASTGIGAILPPYECTFATETPDNESYTVVNSNGDDVVWAFSDYYKSFKYDYNDALAADDWLISPAFRLEAGKIYEFTFSISAGHTMYTERYAVAMGTAPTAEAMTTELIPVTELVGETAKPEIKTLSIKPETTGNYYFGWHALSDAAMFMIQVKGIKVSAPMTSASPAEATDIELTPDVDGHLRLAGSFKAPAADVSGTSLTAPLSKIVVNRVGKEVPVAEFASTAPGADLTFSDADIPEMGTYTYKITAWNAAGDIGRVAAASVYVGPVAPENIPAVRVVETETLGEVVVSWDAPSLTVDGKPLKEENLTYMIYELNDYGEANELLDATISAREARLTVCSPDERDFALFYVKAFNLGLESPGFTRSQMTPVGKPEGIPYAHSFNSDDRAAHLLGYVSPSGTYADVSIGDLASSQVAAQDGDDAFLKIYCPTQFGTPEFFTGKIDLAQAANPAVSIYHYVWSDADTNTFDVCATTSDGTEHLLGTVDHADGYPEGWNMARFSLEKVMGKTVKITVRTSFVSHENMMFDNLRVMDLKNVDLAATAVSAPARVEIGKEFVVKATVTNLGMEDCADYTVALMLNGEEVATAEGRLVESGAVTTFDFPQTLSPLVGDKVEYTVSVTIDGDEDLSNNVSPAAVPQLAVSKLPAVSDLEARRDGSDVTLTWSAPSTVGFDAKGVEDFEDAAAWTEEVDGWTMIDRDGQQIGTLEGAALPESVAMRTRHSFFVFDSESDDLTYYDPELANLVKGNSGSKSLVAMYILSSTAEQDDWAISPALSGAAQTVSFYARSFHPDFLDNMEVLYSVDDSTNPDDFITLCPDALIEVPQLTDAIGDAEYTPYEFALPEGAKRFAIRASNLGGNGLMLMIDDVKMEIANAVLEIESYDIYRDGLKINEALVTATTYADATADASAHRYNVVVKYNRGLSPASNTAELTVLGVGSSIAGQLSVSVEKHDIVVAGAPADAPVRVSAVDGRAMYAGTGSARVSVPAGAYVVTVGKTAFKVLVR